MKKCKSCGSQLIPIGNVWYHPDAKCDEGYGQLFDVRINIVDEVLYDQYKEHYGEASGDEYQKLVDINQKLTEENRHLNNLYTEQAKYLNSSLFSIIVKRLKERVHKTKQ